MGDVYFSLDHLSVGYNKNVLIRDICVIIHVNSACSVT